MACSNQFLVPAGKIKFAPCPGDGAFYMGQTPGGEISVDIKTTEVMDSDNAVSELIAEIAHGVVREFSFKCINPSDNVLALFFAADPSTQTQASGAVTNEAINTVKQGYYYQIGKTASNPTGVRDITTVVVTDDGGSPTTFAAGTDYTVDLALGELYIVPGGGIADDTNLLVDYARTARTRVQHAASPDLNARLTGVLRFTADNTSGPNRDIYGPCMLRADGAATIKRSQGDGKVTEFGFKAKFQRTLDDQGNIEMQSLYIDGRAVA